MEHLTMDHQLARIILGTQLVFMRRVCQGDFLGILLVSKRQSLRRDPILSGWDCVINLLFKFRSISEQHHSYLAQPKVMRRQLFNLAYMAKRSDLGMVTPGARMHWAVIRNFIVSKILGGSLRLVTRNRQLIPNCYHSR